jgi:hypothetical protein
MENNEEESRDGFLLTHKVYVPAQDTTMMDPVSKRKATICNLFATHRLSMKDIARVLDEDYVRIISVIIEGGLVYDRRKKRQVLIPNERRKSFFKKA